MTPDEYSRYDATGLANLIAAGLVSAAEVTQAAIEAIERLNPQLSAVIDTCFDQAIDSVSGAAEAKSSRGPGRQPLFGVPWLIKDLNTVVEGLHDTNGSRAFTGPPANADSELVQRYRRAGLVILGKTNTPEFGMNICTAPTRHGPTRHPLDPARSVGGSSGGSAAAVSSGMLPAAHATDSGGSIRIPASNCGLFGLKPSRSRVPLGNDSSEAVGGFSTGHAVTHSVRDSAALLDAVRGPLPGDGYRAPHAAASFGSCLDGPSPGPLRIAMTAEGFAGEPIHADCVAAVGQTAELLQSLGHEVVSVSAPIDGHRLLEVMDVVFSVNIALAVESFPEQARDEMTAQLEAATRAAVVHAQQYNGVDYAKALMGARQTTAQLAELFANHDLLLTPTLAHPSRPIGYHDPNETDWPTFFARMFGDIPFTPLFNATGGPAMSVPLGRDATGLPVGVQFGAPLGGEAMLLRLAAQLEQVVPWHDRR